MLNATVSSPRRTRSRAIRSGSVPRLAGTRAPGSRRLAAAQYTRLARLAVWTTFASTGSLAIAGLAAIVARSSSSIHSGLGLRAMRAPRGSAHEFAAKVVAMPRADLRASGCNLHTMLALLCRIHTARPVCARNHGVGLLDESTVLNNLRHTAICEIRHRPGIVTQLVVVVASNHMVNCAAGAFCTSSGR